MSVARLAYAQGMSEFGDFTGDCMWASLLMCLHAVDPAHYPATLSTLDAMVRTAIARGWAASEGQATLAHVVDYCHSIGLTPAKVYPYVEPWPETVYHPLLTATAGYGAILLQVANGAAFGVQGNLQYHAVFVGGHDTTAQTYLVGDPCNPACYGGALVSYSLAQLFNSRPCGALVFAVPPVAASQPTPATPAPSPLPGLDIASIKQALAIAAQAIGKAQSLL